jgi:hypothetical protein
MLLIDGVRYDEWKPQSEIAFENLVKEHTQDIFGTHSFYLDIKPHLKSMAGLGSIPDGISIIFGKNPEWYIVEAELSSHSLYEHIVPQVARFTAGMKNPTTQRKVVDVIYNEILKDTSLSLKLKNAVSPIEIHKFISDLISKQPILTIIIDKLTPELEDIETALAHLQIKIIEFRTFTQEGANTIHAHLFEPLFAPSIQPVTPISGDIWVQVTGPKWHSFWIPKDLRAFFPGFHDRFILIADNEEIETCVAGADKNTPHGDPQAGTYFSWHLKKWFDKHPAIKEGDKIKVSIVEFMKKYRLEIVN